MTGTSQPPQPPKQPPVQGKPNPTKNVNPTLGFWIESELTILGADNSSSIAFMAAWSQCEGPAKSQGAYNPLNTTWPGTSAGKNGPAAVTTKSGATINIKGPLGGNPDQNGGDPVKNYADFTSGILATAATISSTGIAKALKSGDIMTMTNALSASKWGTNPNCVGSTAQYYMKNDNALGAKLQEIVANNGNFLPGDLSQLGGNFNVGALGDIGSAEPGIGPVDPLNELESIAASIASWVTNKSNWIRIGFVALGVVLFVIGIPFILLGTKTGKGITKVAGTLA